MNKMMLKKQYMMYAPKKKVSRLPSEYQEVEYIQSLDQSEGTTYFETNIKYNSSNKYVFELEIKALPTTVNYTSFGWDGGGQINVSKVVYDNGMQSIGINTLEKTKFIQTIEAGTSTNSIITAINSSETKTLTRKHENLSSYAMTNGYGIFVRFSYGSIGEIRAFQLYSFKCSINGVLTNELVPCYRKSDNEVGLYDIVENKFYTNQGTGTFLMGRPLVYDTIQGYQQVDYIEKQYSASNSSYLDSGIPASNDLVVEAELFNEIGTTDGSCAVFGSRIGFKNKDYTLNFANAISNGTKYDSRFGSNAYNYGDYLVEYPNDYHILTWGNGALKINGETKLTMTNTSFQSTLNVYLFAGNSNGSVGFYEGSGKTKVKWLKMTKNGVLVRNFIPMKRISDNEIGMYDLVTNTFFTNQGSGEFLSGEVLKA